MFLVPSGARHSADTGAKCPVKVWSRVPDCWHLDFGYAKVNYLFVLVLGNRRGGVGAERIKTNRPVPNPHMLVHTRCGHPSFILPTVKLTSKLGVIYIQDQNIQHDVRMVEVCVGGPIAVTHEMADGAVGGGGPEIAVFIKGKGADAAGVMGVWG